MTHSIESGLSRPSSGIQSPPQKTRSRTQSISSDRPSTLGHSLMSPPLAVSPEAAFIAASAASQIVTNDHDSHADAWYDQHGMEPSGETALVSPAALHLVNNFLDQLLFNFLSIARSTTLTSLRPAVSEVLKPKLAKDAVNQADEELREYLGGGDDEDLLQQSPEAPNDWDLELVWKRTRLRCMVYSSLGDLEEEDEDYYMEQEHLDGDDDRPSETVSPAVAIFLTSILEFMGEQALVVAGQAAYHRLRVKYDKELKEGARSPVDVADRIVVEELDMERVALDRTLGRLWRAWKKRIRSPTIEAHSFSRPFSRDSSGRALQGSHTRHSSLGTEMVPETLLERPPLPRAKSSEQSEEVTPKEPGEEYLRAAAIPLPMGERDLAELLISGLAYYSDDEEEDVIVETEKSLRPKSLMIFPGAAMADLPTPTSSQPQTPLLPPPRKRANSLPTPSASPYRSRSPPTDDADEVTNDATETGDTSETDATTSLKPVGPISSIVAGAAAVGSAAAAGLASIVTGSAVETQMDESDGDAEEGEDIGEFEILTSSRVSMSGRSSSPTASEHSRPLSINPGLPTRSASIHSVRMIDMAGPRSPVSRSRNSSVEAQEHAPLSRPSNLSRNSAGTPPIAEERRKATELTSGLRNSGSAKPQRTHASESISEAEEAAELTGTPIVESVSTPGSEPTSATRFEDLQSQLQSNQPIFGSAHRHTSPPQSPVQQTTKVTIISSTHSSTSFFDAAPEVVSKSPESTKPSSPIVPDRSASRPAKANSPTTTQQPSTIGVISVTSRQESPEPQPVRTQRSSPARSREQQQPSIRPSHTSGSSYSSSSRYKSLRASEDSASMRPEDVARNFEELIQSDQTIQYTLTPESMRDLDSSSVAKARMSEDARPTGDRSRSSSMNKNLELKRATSVSRSTGLHSHPVEVPRSPPGVPPKSRGPAPQAREARVPRESLADFAEFIRATGPVGEAAPVQPIGVAVTPGSVRNATSSFPRSKTSVDSSRTSMTSRARYQARDAAVDYKDDNSDLIDFIRRGPPNSGNPRIPRTVAPFRSTMDSDQLAGAAGGKAVDARLPDLRYSGTSTNVTESSMNSSSGLLKKDRVSPKQNMFDDSDMMPKRKTRRVKDPYAIDFSGDEDEEDDDMAPRRGGGKRAQPKEESLIDFLKSAAPPPESSPMPFNISQKAQSRPLPKKKASAPSLMARFTSRASGSPTSPSYGGKISPREPAGGPDPRPVSSRTSSGRGYIPIQVNMPPGLDKYTPTAPPPPSNAKSSGRVAMKKFEPREAQPATSRTSDLADFFRNSGPPMRG